MGTRVGPERPVRAKRCYQVMEADNRTVPDEWMANWSGTIDFEVHPVVTSHKAVEIMTPRL